MPDTIRNSVSSVRAERVHLSARQQLSTQEDDLASMVSMKTRRNRIDLAQERHVATIESVDKVQKTMSTFLEPGSYRKSASIVY